MIERRHTKTAMTAAKSNKRLSLQKYREPISEKRADVFSSYPPTPNAFCRLLVRVPWTAVLDRLISALTARRRGLMDERKEHSR